MKIENSCFRL